MAWGLSLGELPGEQWVAAYAAWHQVTGMSNPSLSRHNETGGGRFNRIALLRCHGQLGNQVLEFLSAVLYAALAQRVLLIDRQGACTELLTLFDPPFDWLALDAAALSAHSGPIIATLHHSLPSAGMDHMRCEHFGRSSAHRVVTLSGDQLSAGAILQNPHYAAMLRAAFPAGDVIGVLAAGLLRPKRQVAEAAARFERAHFGGDNHLVMGVQWRPRGAGGEAKPPRTVPHGRGGRRLARASASMAHAKSAMAQAASRAAPSAHPAAELIGRCLAASLSPAARAAVADSSLRVSFFLASRDDGMALALQQRYPSIRILRVSDWRRADGTPELAGTGSELALLDAMLVGRANDTITSPYSTFGYLAALLARRPPLELSCAQPSTHEGTRPTCDFCPAATELSGAIDLCTPCRRLPTYLPCFHAASCGFRVWAEKSPCKTTAPPALWAPHFRQCTGPFAAVLPGDANGTSRPHATGVIDNPGCAPDLRVGRALHHEPHSRASLRKRWPGR
jgi:hypothetical protein